MQRPRIGTSLYRQICLDIALIMVWTLQNCGVEAGHFETCRLCLRWKETGEDILPSGMHCRAVFCRGQGTGKEGEEERLRGHFDSAGISLEGKIQEKAQEEERLGGACLLGTLKQSCHQEKAEEEQRLGGAFWESRRTSATRVLDNLKDYAVRALVTAVDHLGTVAYKLTDLFEQQTMDISTIEFKISCLDQRRLTCQTYVDKEGLRQQQIFSNTLRHHKHYILPNSVIREEQNQFSQTQSKTRPDPSGTPATKTLSWYLALETSSAVHRATNATVDSRDSKPAKLTSEFFHLSDVDPKETALSLPASTHLQSSSGAKDHLEVSKPLSAFKSFDSPRHKLFRAPVRNKSMLALFLAKKKALKPKKSYVR